MSIVLITGSGGLVGSTAARHFAELGLDVVGVDNDMRGRLFGPGGSTAPAAERLAREVPDYEHHDLDVRDRDGVEALCRKHGRDVALVVHCASQPSHDGADPLVDWDIDANGTVNVLEAARAHAPDALLVHLSTIKVYGPHPNRLDLEELDTRYEILPHEADTRIAADLPPATWEGIAEDMSIDGAPHSVFGAAKTAADVMVQEYGHWLRTVSLRPGCMTGSAHAGVEAHGMLSWLMRCVATGTPYRIFGYGGKQVRDQIHAHDVATAIEAIWRDPPDPGTVYNLGGGRGRDVSILEALKLAEEIAGRRAVVEYIGEPRRGDHRWWITDMARFMTRYPDWSLTYDVPAMLREIHEAVQL